MNNLQIFLKYKEEYINEFIRIGSAFYDAVEILEKEGIKKWSTFFLGGGFLASRCAECYLKALIMSYELNEKGYKKINDSKHNLIKLHKLILTYDKEAKILEESVGYLNKYSGTKIMYPEDIFKEVISGHSKIYGNDYFVPLTQVKHYVEQKFK